MCAQRLAIHPPAQFITTQKSGGDCSGGRVRLADCTSPGSLYNTRQRRRQAPYLLAEALPPLECAGSV
jgi:hypothetical protein